jgi:ATP-dependent HslUV protease subunit HslV
MGGDGQVTLGDTVLKHQAVKVRRLYRNQVLGGFAGQGADALTLLDRYERKLEAYSGDLRRAAVELVREWRTERAYERLDAMLLVADKETILLMGGNGEIIEPDLPILAIGSGGPYAYASALALYEHTELPAERIVETSLMIASRLCIYTNTQFHIEVIR